MEQRAAEGFSQSNAAQEVRTEPLPVGGNVGAYNSFWTEEGTAVVQTGRTSLISDPPNGQLHNSPPKQRHGSHHRRTGDWQTSETDGCRRTDQRRWD